MSVDDQVESLKARHAELDMALSRENSRPMPDAVIIADLKKRKLRIKDALARLQDASV